MAGRACRKEVHIDVVLLNDALEVGLVSDHPDGPDLYDHDNDHYVRNATIPMDPTRATLSPRWTLPVQPYHLDGPYLCNHNISRA